MLGFSGAWFLSIDAMAACQDMRRIAHAAKPLHT
jgi:hypothetical protein